MWSDVSYHYSSYHNNDRWYNHYVNLGQTTTSTTTTRPTSNVPAVTVATNTETNITVGINVGVHDRQIYDPRMQLTEILVQI